MCKLFAGEIKSEELEKEVNAYKESIDELSKQSIESAIQSIESIKTKESESKPMSNPVSSLIVPDLLKQAGVRIACETTSAATKDLIVKILKDRGADDFIISTVAEYIDTPIGQSAISLVYAFGLPQAKRIEFFNKNSEMVDAVVKEFQIQAATKSGKVALEALKNLFLPVIQQALALMSSDEEQAQESSEKQQSQVA